MPSWDPDIYERYKTYRDRPALDLMLQIPGDLDPREIWDLGCGTGEHAALLAKRHPKAVVHGLDSSPEMLAQARKRDAQVDWVLSGIEAWSPKRPPDLIFTNAALQWLPDHAALYPRLFEALAPGGVFACQTPTPYETRHYAMLLETVAFGPWAARLASARVINPTPSMDAYYAWLEPLAAWVDIWTTTYLHVLEGDDPVVEWMRGTGLRPFLDALPDLAEQQAFLDDFRARIAAAFPPQPGGETLFPFQRLFIVAQRR
jgi:trans-aconitate 2-methyltransferase